MQPRLRIGLVQMKPGASQAENLRQARERCAEAADSGAELVVLPEYFGDLFGAKADPRDPAHPPERLGEGPCSQLLAELASSLGVTLHGGSFLEADDERVYNTTAVYDPSGAVHAVYRKRYLFECPAVPRGSGNAESDFILAGTKSVVYEVNGLRVGCATCWDLRFPDVFEDYRRSGCSLVVCPAAFFADVPTDISFWDALVRGRAIDLAGYIATATISGIMPEAVLPHPPISFHGVTRLVDPFGKVVVAGDDSEPGCVLGEVRADRIEEGRANHPV